MSVIDPARLVIQDGSSARITAQAELIRRVPNPRPRPRRFWAVTRNELHALRAGPQVRNPDGTWNLLMGWPRAGLVLKKPAAREISAPRLAISTGGFERLRDD